MPWEHVLLCKKGYDTSAIICYNYQLQFDSYRTVLTPMYDFVRYDKFRWAKPYI